MDTVGYQAEVGMESELNSNPNSREGGLEAPVEPANPDFVAAYDKRLDRVVPHRFAPGNTYRWQPGTTGNQNGRWGSITDRIRERLDQVMPGDTRKRKQVVADVLVDMACAGNLQAIREVLDRSDGKVTQRLEVGADASRMSDAEIDEALAASGVDLEALARLVEERALLEAETGTGREQGGI